MNDFIKAIFLCDTFEVEKIRLPLGNEYAIINEQYYTAGFKIALRLAIETFNLSDIFDT